MSVKQTEVQEIALEKLHKFFQSNNYGIGFYSPRLGKCRLTIELWKKLYKVQPTILVTYPNNTLEDVWRVECEKWGYFNENIIYCNFRSLHKYLDTKIDFFCIDELHEASEVQRDYCHQIMTNTAHTKTLALSGTISKETKELWGMPIIDEYSTDEAIKEGILADYTVTVKMVDLDNSVFTKNKKGKLQSEKGKYAAYSFVINKMIKEGKNYMALALTRNRLSMNSIGKMKALRALLEELKDKRVIIFTGLKDVAESIGIPYFHSDSGDEGLNLFQEEKCNHLALVNTGGFGITYTNLDCVILLNFVGNEEAVTQQCFRALKLDYKSKSADLRILCLKEAPEIKKIEKSLSMLDKNKVKYI